jgi:hypothetical protein
MEYAHAVSISRLWSSTHAPARSTTLFPAQTSQ